MRADKITAFIEATLRFDQVSARVHSLKKKMSSRLRSDDRQR